MTGKKASNLLDPMSPKQVMAHLAVRVDCKSDQNNMHAGVRPQIRSGDTSPIAAGSPNTDCGVESDSRTSNHQLGKGDNCSQMPRLIIEDNDKVFGRIKEYTLSEGLVHDSAGLRIKTCRTFQLIITVRHPY
ncbi:hypothetical protein C4D60_Mb06t22280 [Musa balbisiana]|uniref:Uncharacterized protein n=1 Tax=Musa balbisiana TaxID=52838 RepID=A0A4S8IPT7_MUSBA|nr:hypothetical protein C4D60_Mb06t22280 [Musa balbisiana]